MTATPEATSRKTVISAPDGAGWTLVIPKGWSSLTTDERTRSRQLKRLLDRRFAGVSRDELATVRHEIRQALEEQLVKAAAQGVRHVHVQTQTVRGVPVSASLLVTVLDNLHDNAFPAALERALGGAEGVLEHGPSRAGPYASMRRVRRTQSRPGGPEGPTRWETVVDHVIEVSSNQLVLLTFATTTDQVAGPLVMLFDAIASSLRPADEGVSTDDAPLDLG